MDILRSQLVLLLLFISFITSSYPSHASLENTRKVTLQLKWSHAFQFAGYYAAKEQGYYEKAGFDVTIAAAEPGIDPVSEVIEGRAQYGVGNSSLVLHRSSGLPVVVLSVIFQHSPAVLISRGSGSNPSIQSLKNKRIMIEPNSDELFAYLKKSGVLPYNYDRVEHSHNITDLINGSVDAISAYSSYEPYLLNSKGFYFHMFTPRESDIDFYGDNLFTSQAIIDESPEEVEAFRQASLKGWKYALSHREEVIELIREEYSPNLDPNHLRFEAQKMQGLLAANLVEVGYMNRERWQRIVSTYQLLGHSVPSSVLEGFIYQPYVSAWDKLREYQIYLSFASFIFIVLLLRHFQISSFNRRLRRVADEDALTGIYNRKHLDEALIEEHQRCIRYHRQYSVIMCDIDLFKAVNDKHGHYVGDEVLKAVANTLNSRIRTTDILGRWGGEEFLLICPETGFEDAMALAEALRICIEQLDYRNLNSVTASFGVATYQTGQDIIDLVKQADQAMYKAKQNGRNRVEAYI